MKLLKEPDEIRILHISIRDMEKNIRRFLANNKSSDADYHSNLKTMCDVLEIDNNRLKELKSIHPELFL